MRSSPAHCPAVRGRWSGDGGDGLRQLAGDVIDEQVAAVLDDLAAGDDDMPHVRRGGGEDGRLRGERRIGTRGPYRVQGDRDQVGIAAGFQPASLGSAQPVVAA